MNEPDRLSDLPEGVIFNILSFIPMQHAVQMSILSKKWSGLWTAMPTLYFDYTLFRLQKGMDDSSSTVSRFVKFVWKVLELHGTTQIQRFRLANYCYSDLSCVNLWIKDAVKKNVQEVHLDLPNHMINLEECLFTCKSLVSLKLKFYLYSTSLLRFPTSICFPNLKTLHLESICFSETDSFLKLLAGCDILENLTVVRCILGDDEVVEISPPTVKNLCIWDSIHCNNSLKISVPNLIKFKYRRHNTEDYFENLSCLTDALIDIPIDRRFYGRSCYNSSFDHVSELLRGVSNARSLTLSDTTLELLSNAPNSLESLPTFHNLNKLILTSDGRRKHFLVISYLLERSSSLESLVIDIKRSSVIRKYAIRREEAGQVSRKLCLRCPLNHLKQVKMKCFQCSGHVLEFLKLLLGNVNTLERVVIIQEEGVLAKIMEIIKKVRTFEKAAANCTISFS